MNGLDSGEIPRLWRLAQRTAFRILRDRHEAEDVAQETLFALWKAVSRGEHVARLDAWVKHTACHLALSAKRRSQKAVLMPYPDEREEYPRPAEGNSLEGLVELLPPLHRSLFRLRYIEDMPVVSIADRLKIPVGTVKWRLNQIRRYFRAQAEP